MALNCYGLMLLVLIIVLFHVCSCNVLDDADKYRNVQKRTFCNFHGCRNLNGKRNYHGRNTKRYSMLNQLGMVEKRSDINESDRDLTSILDDYRQQQQLNNGAFDSSQYDDSSDWTAQIAASAANRPHILDDTAIYDSNKAFSDKDNISHENNINLSDDQSTVRYKFGDIDVANLSLYEKYRILKDTEEILGYLKPVFKKNNAKRTYVKKDAFRRWLEKQK